MRETTKIYIEGMSLGQVANGFFQAEGTVTARVSNKGFISPIVTLNQNLTKESLGAPRRLSL